jgi:hypothetical protein
MFWKCRNVTDILDTARMGVMTNDGNQRTTPETYRFLFPLKVPVLEKIAAEPAVFRLTGEKSG